MKTVKTFETSFIAPLKFEFIRAMHRIFYPTTRKLTNKLHIASAAHALLKSSPMKYVDGARRNTNSILSKE